MKLTEQTQERLERIRERVEQSKTTQTKLSSQELDDLSVVYTEVVAFAGKANRVLDKGCLHCIEQAMGIVFNYICFHEPASGQIRPVKIVKAEKMPAVDLSLKKGENAKSVDTVLEPEEAIYEYDSLLGVVVNAQTKEQVTNLEEVKYDPLFQAAKQKGYKGARPAKKALIAFLQP